MDQENAVSVSEASSQGEFEGVESEKGKAILGKIQKVAKRLAGTAARTGASLALASLLQGSPINSHTQPDFNPAIPNRETAHAQDVSDHPELSLLEVGEIQKQLASVINLEALHTTNPELAEVLMDSQKLAELASSGGGSV